MCVRVYTCVCENSLILNFVNVLNSMEPYNYILNAILTHFIHIIIIIISKFRERKS